MFKLGKGSFDAQNIPTYFCYLLRTSLAGSAPLLHPVTEQRRRIHQPLGEYIDIVVADNRYGYAHRLASELIPHPRQFSTSRSDRIDSSMVMFAPGLVSM